MPHRRCAPALAAASATFFAACSGGAMTAPGAPALPPAAHPYLHKASGKIKHIVIVIQENRSFNDLFYGFPGAETVKYGYDHLGHKIALQPIPLETWWDVQHDSYGYFAACNGTGRIPGTKCRMNGFDREWAGCSSGCPANPTYAYVPHDETKPYFFMGKQYVLADEMYASNFDASSFVSHQYIIAGQAQSAVNYPQGLWGCPGKQYDQIEMVDRKRDIPAGYESVCWDSTTLGDELDNAGVSWAFYTATIDGDEGIWSAYQAIDHIYNGPDWAKDVITPQTSFFHDVNKGKLRGVSWITPTWENSDHAGSGHNTGPSWVASIVNAIGESKYWDSTAIFIFWDDYGGWYDPQPPAYVDYDGLGIRIPMLIVSAYAKKHYISHTHYEHGTILKFVEETFGLPAMAASDARANPPDNAFDFNRAPRRFEKVPSAYDRAFFMHQRTSGRAPDDQ